jgi:uncharacterized protein YidB (DUF937 family)
MASSGTVTVDFAAETAKFTAELKKVRGDLQGIKDATKETANAVTDFSKSIDDGKEKLKSWALATFSIAAVVGAVHAIVDATAEAEKAVSGLDNALLTAGASVSTVSPQFQALATQLQKTTTFSDEAVMGVESLLLSFDGLSGTTIKRATESVLDLATRMGIDAPSAAKMLGKALSDPVDGLTALQKAGVKFNDNEKDIMKALIETGHGLDAQNMILDKVKEKFGGAAEAARNNFGGALEGLKNAFGDLLEAKGGLPGVVGELNSLTKLLQDPKTKAAADSLMASLASAAASVVHAIVGIETEIDRLAKRNAKGIVSDADLTVVQALTKELTIEQNLLKDRQSFGIVTPEQIQSAQNYIETLKQRIELAKQLRAPAAPAADAPPADFVTGGGAEAATAIENAKVAAAAERIKLQQKADADAAAFALLMQEGTNRVSIEMERARASVHNEIEREMTRQYEEGARERTAISEAEAAARLRTHQQVEATLRASRQQTFGLAVQLLQALGGKHKAFAIAAIALETAVRATQIIAATNVAAAGALMPPPIGLGPVAGAPLAAAIRTQGYISAALTAALGGAQIVQAASAGGTAPGTPSNPVFTSNGTGAAGSSGADSRPSIQVFVTGFIGKEQIDQIITSIRDEVSGRDVVLIPANSRQALELRGG